MSDADIDLIRSTGQMEAFQDYDENETNSRSLERTCDTVHFLILAP